jgi:hypothetical protein
MNLEDRIRSQGRATMQTFSPSPDLQNRVITHTERRIRQRRQAAVGVIVGSSALLLVFGVILVNQNSTRSTELNAAGDSAPGLVPTVAATQVATVPQTALPTVAPATVPVTSASLAAPTTIAAPVVASSSAPAATEVPFDGRSITISYEDSLPQAPAEAIAELGVDIPTDDHGAYPTYHLDPTGSGVVTVTSPNDSRVMTATPTGERVTYNLPSDDAAGTMWDAAVGPDGRLYVSRTFDSAQTFTLVVYELDPTDGGVAEVVRHDTDWGCYDGYCGGIVFDSEGVVVDVLSEPAETIAYSTPDAGDRLLPQLAGDPPDWRVDDRCQPGTDDYRFYGTVNSRVTLGGTWFQVSLTCANADAHTGWPVTVQGDGSLIVFDELTGPTREDSPSGVVGHFRADGTQVSFEVGPKIVDITYVDGQYLGIEYYEEGGYGHWRYVRLNPAL